MGHSLPQGWAWATVGELADLAPNSITDGPFGSNLKTEHYTRTGPRVIRLQNIGNCVFKDEMAHISDEHHSRLRKHEIFAGDIVIAAFGDPAPRACIVPEIGPAIVKADCIRFKPTEHIVAPFLMYALNSPEVQHATTARIHGVGRPRINLTEVKEIVLPVAPKAEQARVVAKIEALFTNLDAAVAALKRVQANLKRYRAAVLKAAYEGHLVPTEAELARKENRHYETADQLFTRTLKDRRAKWEADQLAKILASGKPPENDEWKKKYKEPALPAASSQQSLPQGWVWVTSDCLFTFITSGSRGWATYYANAGALFLRIGNLDHDSIDLDLREIQHVVPPPGTEGERTKIEAGDILVSITADVGMTALVPDLSETAYINQHIGLCRPVVSVDRRYVAWYFASEFGQKQFKTLQRGATKTGLGLEDLRSVIIPLPPLPEQGRIVDSIQKALTSVARIGDDCKRSIKRADRLRQSILKRAFEGKLVPQESDDEPASVLLERIRAERAAATSGEAASRQPRIRRRRAGAAVNA